MVSGFPRDSNTKLIADEIHRLLGDTPVKSVIVPGPKNSLGFVNFLTEAERDLWYDRKIQQGKAGNFDTMQCGRRLYWNPDRPPGELSQHITVSKVRAFLLEQKIDKYKIAISKARGLVWIGDDRVAFVQGSNVTPSDALQSTYGISREALAAFMLRSAQRF